MLLVTTYIIGTRFFKLFTPKRQGFSLCSTTKLLLCQSCVKTPKMCASPFRINDIIYILFMGAKKKRGRQLFFFSPLLVKVTLDWTSQYEDGPTPLRQTSKGYKVNTQQHPEILHQLGCVNPTHKEKPYLQIYTNLRVFRPLQAPISITPKIESFSYINIQCRPPPTEF